MFNEAMTGNAKGRPVETSPVRQKNNGPAE